MAFAIVPALVGIGLSTTAASIIASVGSIAIGIGVSLISSLLFRPRQPKPSDGQVVVKQSAAPRFRSYGRVKVAGVLVFANTTQGFYGRVFAMGSGEIDAVEQHWIDDADVTLSGDTVTTSKYVVDGASRVHIEYRLGEDAPTEYTALSANFPTLWDSDHLGKGIPSALVTLQQTKQKDFTDVFPKAGDTQYRQVQRGAKIRAISGGAFAARAWSENAIQIIADYLTHPDGLRLDDSWILNESALWESAQAICNEAVALDAGGTEARYRISNSYFFDERPADVLARYLQACDAVIYPTPNRGIGIRVGKWEAPTVTIDDAAVVAFTEVGRGRDILTTANTIKARFTNPGNDFQEDDAQPWIDAADVALRGEISADIDLFSVASHSQARRLMKIAAHRANPDWVGTLTCNMRALPALGERFIAVSLSELDLIDNFEIINSRFLIDSGSIVTGIEIQIQSFSAAAYEWDETVEEGEAPGEPNDIEPDTVLPNPTGFLAVADGLYAILTWDAFASDFITVEARYKNTSDSMWSTWPVAENADVVVIGPVANDSEYEFQIRTRSDLTGRASGWTASQTLTFHVDTTITTPPPVVRVPVTGDTIDLGSPSTNVLDPAGTLATLTLRLPDGTDGDRVRISTRQRIDALTITSFGGYAVDWTTGELPANGLLDFTLVVSLTRWVRV